MIIKLANVVLLATGESDNLITFDYNEFVLFLTEQNFVERRIHFLKKKKRNESKFRFSWDLLNHKLVFECLLTMPVTRKTELVLSFELGPQVLAFLTARKPFSKSLHYVNWYLNINIRLPA